MTLNELRNDIAQKQKKGLPFILASIVIWLLILVVILLGMPIKQQNLFVFCCSCPLMPLAWAMGKLLKVNLFDKSNQLSKLGFLFTLNQLLYLLIVMWVFSAVPEKMVMVYAMVFGSHLLPYSWLYKSISYCMFAIFIPISTLVLGCFCSASVVTVAMLVIEILFAIVLWIEYKNAESKNNKNLTIEV